MVTPWRGMPPGDAGPRDRLWSDLNGCGTWLTKTKQPSFNVPISTHIKFYIEPFSSRISIITLESTTLYTMDVTGFTYPSPLTGYENAPPLPEERAEDGKSYRNTQTGVLSKAYEKFPAPLDNGRRGGL